MEQPGGSPALERLDVLVGQWTMDAGPPVHRIYEMTLSDGVWKLWRDAPDPFPQRFTGTFSDEGTTIAGRWEKAENASNWETDFDLT